MGGGWIGVHTARPNQVIAEGIAAGRIRTLAGYAHLRRELPYAPAGLPRGRIDIELSQGQRPDALVEVKNVTLLDGTCLRFPDAVSERGRKHLDLLLAAVRAGLRGLILFAVNRPEGDRVGPAWGIDPRYGRRLLEVIELGVEPLAVRLVHGPHTIETGEPLPLDLGSPRDGTGRLGPDVTL